MLLTAMQDDLAALYETPMEHCVMDFLVTDARIARALEAPDTARGNAERLLLRQSDDQLDVTLFIDAGILAALSHSDPYRRLDTGNLNDFLIALEGVSHFNYLVWNAHHERQITQLEMELQAEVDKYVSAMMLLDAQRAPADAGQLHEALFTAVHFDTAADSASGQRYRDANHFAAKYCRQLNRRFPARHRAPAFLNELRRFYRLSQNEKIRCIEQA